MAECIAENRNRDLWQFTYIEDPCIRKNMTGFRISAHNLRIEKGRYKKIERNNRVCLICNQEKIEDELNFTMMF